MIRLPTLPGPLTRMAGQRWPAVNRRVALRAVLLLVGIGMIAYALVRLQAQIEVADTSSLAVTVSDLASLTHTKTLL
jgi:hypothetical protein